MASSVSKTARKYYLVARWSWIVVVAEPLVFFACLMLFGDFVVNLVQYYVIQITFYSLPVIISIASYMKGNSKNNNWPDLTKRMYQARTMSIICWTLAIFIIITQVPFSMPSGPLSIPFSIVFWVQGPIVCIAYPLSIVMVPTINYIYIRKKLKTNHRLPKPDSGKSSTRSKSSHKEYTDDSF